MNSVFQAKMLLVKYRLSCLEEIEETQGGRERRTLCHTEHEPA